MATSLEIASSLTLLAMTEEDVIASRRRGNPRGRVLLDDTLLSLRAKRGNLGGAVTEKEVGIIE